ncbi:hypothetical protein [Prevotella sp.]|uniref:hypothetical protein n=1 Tax=Prevotella sp. TaxID=59823 RepID=UPI003FF0C06E
MKRLLSTLFCLLLAVAAFAQTAEEHLTFLGVPINGSVIDVRYNLIQKGFSLSSIRNQESLYGLYIDRMSRVYCWEDGKTIVCVYGDKRDYSESESEKVKENLTKCLQSAIKEKHFLSKDVPCIGTRRGNVFMLKNGSIHIYTDGSWGENNWCVVVRYNDYPDNPIFPSIKQK